MTGLNRCPAWTTENLTALGNDAWHLRTQLDWLLEDLEDAPDARLSYLESQLAGLSSELARLDGVLHELRSAIDQDAHPYRATDDAQLLLAGGGE
jgi:hypothetical protein